MNERIRELAEQATEYFPKTETSGEYWKFDKEKFAELIVRECIEQGKILQKQIVINGSNEYNSGREMGIEVFMNQIKKHFGVEK